MRKGLYARLAADNIKRNSRTYIPYIITCVMTSAMLYIIMSLSLNEGLDRMQGGYALKEILSFGSYVTQIFAFIFLFYTNSFLVKRRKKEFGLFNILGMEKRHIARVLLLESVYTAGISLAAGMGTGILLDKLMFLLLTKMMGGDVQLGFYISKASLVRTCIFMLFTFLLIYLNALRQIHLAKPIELLRGSDMGEKEPKTKWISAILGIALIGTGYYISIVTKNPLQALTLFFVAVLCVILGTYLLFTAGSIALLKLLKRNKRYYYKTTHFTTVSGMIYRMKQNAVGLANICVLSTMVLVMISATSCLMAGMEDVINERYPFDFSVRSADDDIYEKMESFLHDNDIEATKTKTYTSLSFQVMRDGNRFYIPEEYSLDMDELTEFGLIDLEDYDRLTGSDIDLADNSVLLWSDDKTADLDVIDLSGMGFTVAERIEDYPIGTMGVIKSVCLVVKDRAVMEEIYKLQKAAYGENASQIEHYYHFDVGSRTDQKQLYSDMRRFLDDVGISYGADAKYGAHEDLMGLYGGLFFLGVFLGTLFMMQTILIIYYKQISEGMDDKKRFEIMQNVGMSRREVKRSIRSQILTVFFLPLIMAGIHTGFSFPMIRRLLLMFRMDNTMLFAACLAASFGVFAVIYAAVYSLTARTYYKIVSK